MSVESEMKAGMSDSPEPAGRSVSERLKELGRAARKLEPGNPERRVIAAHAADFVDKFIDALPAMKAYSTDSCDRLRALKVEEHGKDFEDLLGLLRTEVNVAGINSASGANFGYIQSGGVWASSIADMLAAATNRYAGVYFPVRARLSLKTR